MKKTICALLLTGVFGPAAALCSAATVSEQGYEYMYGDAVRSVESGAFTICDGCRSDKLHKMPLPFVAIRMSVPAKAQAVEHMESPSRSFDAAQEGGGSQKAAQRGPELLATVKFKFDSDVLSALEKKNIDKAVEGLPSGVDLVVTGYTCSIGSTSYNKSLSEKRAKAVAKYLKSRKVSVTNVEAKGECCPASTDKKLNRRVEIEKEN